jgi:steroid delta-isomerase-like uncharacterized protein
VLEPYPSAGEAKTKKGSKGQAKGANFGEHRQREVRRKIVRRTSENSLDFGRRHHTGVVKVNLLGEAGKEALMSEENKALVRRSFEEVFNQGNLDAVEETFASDHVLHDPTSPEEIQGTEGMRGYVSMYRSAFPDLQQTIEDQFAEGEKVATRLIGRGTHQGELMGIAPTGNRVGAPGIVINRVSGGKIVESWANYDVMGMMQQLGAIPPPGHSEEASPT